MRFRSLTETEFRNFAKTSPYKSFAETPEIAKHRESSGWTAYYLGVEEDGKLLAATLLIAKPTFLGKSTFIAPGGPLLDLENKPLTDFFLKNLKKFAKTHNGYVLRIDPYYEVVERKRNGEVAENGFNHKIAEENLKNLGFKPAPGSGQPKYSFVLDIKNRTKDQIFAEMKRNTRNHIRKAEKMGVKVRELKREELKIFKQITESTSLRRHFSDKPLSYYEQMYDLFTPRGEVKFMLAEATGVAECATCSAGHEDLARAARSVPEGHAVHSVTPIPLSAAMFMLYGDEVIYLFSGSDEKYMKDYNAQYLIQWHMIKFAADQGFKRYNFYGINGLPDPSSKDYGIYDFKKGFTSEETGRVTELIGAHEAPLSPFFHLHKLLQK